LAELLLKEGEREKAEKVLMHVGRGFSGTRKGKEALFKLAKTKAEKGEYVKALKFLLCAEGAEALVWVAVCRLMRGTGKGRGRHWLRF